MHHHDPKPPHAARPIVGRSHDTPNPNTPAADELSRAFLAPRGAR